MTIMARAECHARREQWRRYAAWHPPTLSTEVDTRLRWLSDAVALAHSLGIPLDEPFDSPAIRDRRRRIRRALAGIRD
jgi:hypothetical protein